MATWLDTPEGQSWAAAYQAEHGHGPGEGNDETLDEAIGNMLWSRERAEQGRETTQEDWENAYYSRRGGNGSWFKPYQEMGAALATMDLDEGGSSGGRESGVAGSGSGSGNSNDRVVEGPNGYPIPSLNQRAAAGDWPGSATGGLAAAANAASGAGASQAPGFGYNDLLQAGQGLVDGMAGMLPSFFRGDQPPPLATSRYAVPSASDRAAASGYGVRAESPTPAPPLSYEVVFPQVGHAPPRAPRREGDSIGTYDYPAPLRGAVPAFFENVGRGAGIAGGALDDYETARKRDRNRFFGQVRGLWDWMNQPGT